MSTQPLKITSATWDKRPKTKFLTVEGIVTVKSFDDTIKVKITESQGINQNILLIQVNVIHNDGPLKPQPSPFYYQHMTNGDEPWTHIQVTDGQNSDTFPITIQGWNGSPEFPDTESEGVSAKNFNDPISSLIGKQSRIYTTGDALTEDYMPDRVNVELDTEKSIVNIWLG
jgi:hypothetical protein